MTSKTGTPARPTRKPAGTGKRTLTRENWWKTLSAAMASAPVLLRALIRPTISRALREKMMLEVTAVNECRYCQWGHTHLAVAQGVPLEEINQIFGYQNEALAARDTAEAAAILFAQHYAERREEYDPASMEDLRTVLQRGTGDRDPRVPSRDHAGEPDGQHAGCAPGSAEPGAAAR